MGTWLCDYDTSSSLTGPTGKSYSGICGMTTGRVTNIYEIYSPFNGQIGRVYRTVRMDGSGTFVTKWSYNLASLVAWMKYLCGNSGRRASR